MQLAACQVNNDRDSGGGSVSPSGWFQNGSR
ncbi:colicin release lysis protein [Escherichia coli]|nr:colicin release lysis protein [Escherichia coli]